MNRVIPEGSHVLVDPDRQPANGSTNCSVGEHIRVFVVRRAFVLLVR